MTVERHIDGTMEHDVVIVGGGVAGLSGALVLGRARRRVLLFDTGAPRNAPAHSSHGFFTRDGTPPLELIRMGREQLAPYESVKLRDARVVAAETIDGGFAVTLDDGERIGARTLLLATGVTDLLPPIPGIRELWGRGVFHCPYCHGWEVRDQPLAIHLGTGATGFELALLLTAWSRDLLLCTDGDAGLSPEQRERLGRNGIAVREERIERLIADDGEMTGILFAGGEVVPRRGLFLRPAIGQHAPLAGMLGCTMTELGTVAVNEMGETTIPGVFAAGDDAARMHQIAMAAATGAMAAAAINRRLVMEDTA